MDRQNPLSTATYRESSDQQRVPGSGGVDRRGGAEARVGQVLAGRFSLTGLLGVGSFGDVYEAVDLQGPSEPVALKLLRHPSAQAQYRFKREFRALAETSHPNLVALHELFLGEHETFFTLELVRGVDFYSFVRPAGVLSRERLMVALHGLMEGVGALHARGRLHRDLKPGNVLCTPDGRVVIVDFGLATLFASSDEQGSEQGFVGTANYAAPEQLALGEVGPESDWYAVGTMLYEALSGTLPFEGPFNALWAAKGVAPRALPELPADLDALKQLCLHLLAMDKVARASAPDIARAVGQVPRLQERVADQPFVGRTTQLAELRTLFAEVEQGALRAPLVLATSGLGKTALVERFLDELRRNHSAVVLRGRCYVNEDIAYRAVDGIVDALSHHLSSLPPAKSAALLPRDARALARLFPVLNRVPAIAAAPVVRSNLADDRSGLRTRAVEALRELLRRMADHLPVVLFIDDIQWDDEDSGWFLSTLLNDADPPSLLLVATCRSDVQGQSHVLRALARHAVTAAVLKPIALPPMSADETLVLASHVLAHTPEAREAARTIAQESAGHPLFTLELSRFSRAVKREPVPHGELSLEHAICSRSELLTPPARTLLELVCVAGHRVRLRSALAAAGLETAPVRELVAARLGISSGTGLDGTLEVYHDRIREALVAALPVPRRRTLHAAIAGALAEEQDPPCDLIVEHYLSADQPERAAKFALRAADHAAQVLALHRLPALLTLALTDQQPEQRTELYVRLGEAYALIGRTGDAARAYQAAIELSSDDEQRWELTRLAMGQALLAEDYTLGQSLLRDLDRQLGRHAVRPSFLRALACAARYFVWLAFGPPRLRTSVDERHARIDRKRLRVAFSAATGLGGSQVLLGIYYCVYAFALAARVGDVPTYASMLALMGAGRGVARGKRFAASERMLSEARALADSSADPDVRLFVSINEASYSLYTFYPARAEQLLDENLHVASPTTALGGYMRSIVALMCGPVFFWGGRLRHMQDVAQRRARDLQELPDPHTEAGVRALTAYRHLRNDDAEAAWSDWQATADRYPDHSALRGATWGVVLALYDGNLTRAQRALDLALRLFWYWDVYSAPARNILFWNIASLARLRRAASGARLRDRLVGRVARWAMVVIGLGGPRRNGLYALELAAHRFEQGDVARAVPHLEQALEQFRKQGMLLYAAVVDLALAQHHPDAQRRSSYQSAADAYFAEEQVARPDKWLRALLPGVPISETAPASAPAAPRR